MKHFVILSSKFLPTDTIFCFIHKEFMINIWMKRTLSCLAVIMSI